MAHHISLMASINTFLLTLVAPFLSFKKIHHLLDYKTRKLAPFRFNGQALRYFYHSYNNSFMTERCIEIPIIQYYKSEAPYRRVLEIGNVTKHYYDLFKDFQSKDTVDKYEKAYDVVNRDIREYRADAPYDFIYSISTFEHMDSDGGRNADYRTVRHPHFTSQAFLNIDQVVNDLLAPGGKFIVTFPLGYCQAEIDQSVRRHEYRSLHASGSRVFLMKKTGPVRWEQVDFENNFDVLDIHHVPEITYLCVLEITK